MSNQYEIWVFLKSKWQVLPGWPTSYAFWDNKEAAIKHAESIQDKFEDILVERIGVEVWRKG